MFTDVRAAFFLGFFLGLFVFGLGFIRRTPFFGFAMILFLIFSLSKASSALETPAARAILRIASAIRLRAQF